MVIGIQLTTGALISSKDAATPGPRKVAILPLRFAAGGNAELVSHQLTSELQHEIASRTGLTVIAPQEHFRDAGCVTLTGAVASNPSVVRITATLIDNRSGEITWSHAFEYPAGDPILTTTAAAREIVAALPQSLVAFAATGNFDAS